jgi:hypothetical protein
MSLSDLAVFNRWTYDTLQEHIPEQVNLFNAAVNGAIVLQAASNTGDYDEGAHWKLIDGLVRRRDAYGDGDVAEKTLIMGEDRTVKVAAGTPPVRIDPGMMRWIQKSPEEAGLEVGRQLAESQLEDMLRVGIVAYIAAVSQNTDMVKDGTAGTATLPVLLGAASLFGDREGAIAAWIMHSKVMFDLWGTALANTAALFSFGNVNVRQDGFGRPFVISDIDALKYTSSGQKYRTLGVVRGGIQIGANNDFDFNVETSNGKENIKRTVQYEWSYNLGLKGYAWDKGTDGENHSPSDAAIATSANWDQSVASDKDTAGVLLNTQ